MELEKAMKRIALLLLLSSCAPDTMTTSPSQPANVTQLTSKVYRVHDVEARVTCWVVDDINGRGITCIPDYDYGGKVK